MKAAEYDVMAAAEDGLWWYRGLRRLLVDSLHRACPAGPPGPVIDVGCGTGGTYLAVRRAFGNLVYVGLDVESKALAYARGRGLGRLAYASADAVPLRPGAAGAIICLDVLCYASVDPARALAGFLEALRPGGFLFLNLPAFESLRGEHDLAVGISHRFRAAEVWALCEGAGFEVRSIRYWNTVLSLPLLGWRRWSRTASPDRARSDTARSPRWLNGLCGCLVMGEIALARWIRWPFGSSVLAVAQRPPRPSERRAS